MRPVDWRGTALLVLRILAGAAFGAGVAKAATSTSWGGVLAAVTLWALFDWGVQLAVYAAELRAEVRELRAQSRDTLVDLVRTELASGAYDTEILAAVADDLAEARAERDAAREELAVLRGPHDANPTKEVS